MKIYKLFKKYRGVKPENDIDYKSAKVLIQSNSQCILLDVRSEQEYKEGHLDGSINIPVYDINEEIEKVIPNRNNPIIVYCQSGSRSRKAVNILSKKGYEELYNIEGGLDNIE